MRKSFFPDVSWIFAAAYFDSFFQHNLKTLPSPGQQGTGTARETGS